MNTVKDETAYRIPPDISQQVSPAQDLQRCLTHLCFKTLLTFKCVREKALGGDVLRKQTGNSVTSVMAAFSEQAGFRHIIPYRPLISVRTCRF